MESKLRALVIEDTSALAQALVLLLSHEGYDVTFTASGAEALLLVARERFDVVVADLQVEELGGPGVWHAMRDLSDVPVIAMSALSSAWQDEALAAGVVACFTKPFDLDDLLAVMREVTRPGRAGVAPPQLQDLSDEDLRSLASLDERELDALPFGLIRVAPDGRIVGFNAYEERSSGYSAATVIGLPFDQLAPCTRVKEFSSEVELARVRSGESRVLRFRFPLRGAKVAVSVRLYHDASSGVLWIFAARALVPARER